MYFLFLIINKFLNINFKCGDSGNVGFLTRTYGNDMLVWLIPVEIKEHIQGAISVVCHTNFGDCVRIAHEYNMQNYVRIYCAGKSI